MPMQYTYALPWSIHITQHRIFLSDVSGIRDKMHTGSDHDLQLQGTTIDPTILQATMKKEGGKYNRDYLPFN